jgi:hypothetical protein
MECCGDFPLRSVREREREEKGERGERVWGHRTCSDTRKTNLKSQFPSI